MSALFRLPFSLVSCCILGYRPFCARFFHDFHFARSLLLTVLRIQEFPFILKHNKTTGDACGFYFPMLALPRSGSRLKKRMCFFLSRVAPAPHIQFDSILRYEFRYVNWPQNQFSSIVKNVFDMMYLVLYNMLDTRNHS